MTPADHATAAAEAIRSLNHATLTGGYQWPSDVYDTLGEMERAARMLPQALNQAATWLERQHDAGRIGHDTRDDVGMAVTEALHAIRRSAFYAQRLQDGLGDAHQACSHLTGVEDPCS